MSTPGAYFRLVRIGWVLAREDAFSAVPSEHLPPLARFVQRLAGLLARRRARLEARSGRLARAVERLGPSYVKIGQFLATRPDVVGAELAADLSLLQDRMATFPESDARAAIEGSLGRPVDALFAEFSEPMAAASIAQVHPAVVLRDGKRERVAVKVIRPGVRQRFAADIEAMYLVSRMQGGFFPIRGG